MSDIWFGNGYGSWVATLGPVTMQILEHGEGYACYGAMRCKAVTYGATRSSLQDAKDACEIRAVDWLRAERDALNEALRLLGKD